MDTKHRNCKASTSYFDGDEEEKDPFETDEDSDFNPDSDQDVVYSNEIEAETIDSDDNVGGDTVAAHVTPKRTRKRRRNIEEWGRARKKHARIHGEEYKTSKGKLVKKCEMKGYEHTCRYECKRISEEERQNIFSKFYKLPSYDLQTNFLASCIQKTQPARKKNIAGVNKKFSTCIRLMNLRVCKKFFLSTLDITNRRFTSVCSKISKEGFVEPDRRGKHQPSNKICDETKKRVIEHIKMFPRYKSHYSRAQNDSTRYLPSDLNIRKMYGLYREWCTENNQQSAVKESFYRRIFSSEFNLKFHKPHSDTCNTCDRLNNTVKNSQDEEMKRNANFELELHQRKVKNVEEAKKRDVEFCSQNKHTTRLVCFDLQKTLPTPLITTNKVYYLRQLWTYNFCIHDIVSGKSYMYTWNETTASSGSQKIGSCLIKFIKDLPNEVQHLICYSNSCGGQNKNKNIGKLFMYIVQATNVKTIEHKFFEPGHSYMECDRSFGIIEKNKKRMPQVFVPGHWTSVIQKSSMR